MSVVELDIIVQEYDFSGGLNTKASKMNQEPSDLSDIFNMEFQAAGGLKVRGGKLKLNSEATASFDTLPIYGLYPFYIPGGTSQLLAICNNKLWKYAPAGNNFSNITITGGDFTGSQRKFSFTGFTDTSGVEWVVICNGRDSPIYYNGTTATRLSSTGAPHADWTGTTQPAQIVSHRSRLYAFIGSKVYISNLGSVTNLRDWTTTAATAQIEFASDYGEITALYSFYTTLIVFFKDSIRRLEGTSPDDFSTLPALVTAVVGCESFKLIQPVGADLVFTSRDGVHSLQGVFQFGDIKAQYLSEKIEESTAQSTAHATWDDINKGSGRLETDACSVYYPSRNQYWLSCERTTSTTNNMVFVGDARVSHPRLAWTIFNYTIAAACKVDSARISLADAVSGQTTRDLLVFGDYSGVVWIHDLQEFDDTSTDILARFSKFSKGVDGGKVYKSYRHLFFHSKPSSTYITVTDTYEQKEPGELGGTSQTVSLAPTSSTSTLGTNWTLGVESWGAPTGFQIYRADLGGQGRTDEIKFEYTDTTGWTMLGYDIQGKPIRIVTENT